MDHFEHLVRINDPAEPRLEWLARAAWQQADLARIRTVRACALEPVARA